MFNSTVPAAEIKMILNSEFHFVALSKDIKNKKAQFCPTGSGVQSAEFLSFKAAAPRAGIGIPVKKSSVCIAYGGFSVLWAPD